jgi:hypothetical protein
VQRGGWCARVLRSSSSKSGGLGAGFFACLWEKREGVGGIYRHRVLGEGFRVWGWRRHWTAAENPMAEPDSMRVKGDDMWAPPIDVCGRWRGYPFGRGG